MFLRFVRFEPYADLVGEAYTNWNAELVSNQDAYEQIENFEANGASYNEHVTCIENNENRSISNFSFGSFMPQILTDDEIAANIKSLNKKQGDVFNIAYKWARDYVKGMSQKRMHTLEPIHIFLSGSGGTGKSHLTKTIYQALSKEFLYHDGDPDKPRVLLLGPTGISAVNIGGITIHSALGIKPGIKLMVLSNKAKAILWNKLSEVKMLIIDENQWFQEICFTKLMLDFWRFLSPTPIPFAGLSIVVLGDFLQLPSVRGKPIYALIDDHERIEGFLSLDLWNIFKFVELTEVMRQRGDIEFIEFLNKIRVGNLDESVQTRLKARFIKENDVNHPRNALHMFSENSQTLLHNKEMLMSFPGVLHKTEAIDVISGDCKYPKSMILSAQNRK